MEISYKSAIFLVLVCSSVPIMGKAITANSPNNDPDKECTSEAGDGYKFASPYSCTEFYVCDHFKAYLHQCPNATVSGDQLYFDPELKICNWPSMVNCTITTTETPATEYTTTPMQKIHDERYKRSIVDDEFECPPNSNGHKFASPTNCSEYYVCLNGYTYLFACPPTASGILYFDPELEVCNWPWLVDCQIKTTTHEPTTTTEDNSTAQPSTTRKPLTTTEGVSTSTTHNPTTTTEKGSTAPATTTKKPTITTEEAATSTTHNSTTTTEKVSTAPASTTKKPTITTEEATTSTTHKPTTTPEEVSTASTSIPTTVFENSTTTFNTTT